METGACFSFRMREEKHMMVICFLFHFPLSTFTWTFLPFRRNLLYRLFYGCVTHCSGVWGIGNVQLLILEGLGCL